MPSMFLERLMGNYYDFRIKKNHMMEVCIEYLALQIRGLMSILNLVLSAIMYCDQKRTTSYSHRPSNSH